MTTLDDVRMLSGRLSISRGEMRLDRDARDLSVRQCYSAGNATMAQLAQATGLSKQRVSVIVHEGEG